MKQEFRCDCPITSALDLLGDRWMLVIVKQMMIQGMKTFKEFAESDEAVSSNILSSKLKCLEQYGIIERTSHPTNKKTKLYYLTERGLALTPVVIEMAIWSNQNLRGFNPVMRQSPELEAMKADKAAFIELVQTTYRQNMPERP